MLQRTPPAGFVAPCLPTKTDKPPSGSQWLHEIKHDGFRVTAKRMAREHLVVCRSLTEFEALRPRGAVARTSFR
jgi:ATP-dependent DNA ligase